MDRRSQPRQRIEKAKSKGPTGGRGPQSVGQGFLILQLQRRLYNENHVKHARQLPSNRQTNGQEISVPQRGKQKAKYKVPNKQFRRDWRSLVPRLCLGHIMFLLLNYDGGA